MSLLSVAEKLLRLDRSIVVLEPQRCLHSAHKLIQCTACFDVCPVEALQGGPVPYLDPERCVNCLACLPVCPVGAYSADDEAQSLITCASKLPARSVELVCGKNPDPNTVLVEAAVPLQLRGCLAGLGASSYLALAALGIESIAVRGEACADCPLSALAPVIEQQVKIAQAHLDGCRSEAVLSWHSSLENEALTPKTAWDVHNPPISRRDLFRIASWEGQTALGRVLTSEQPGSGNHPSQERLRIANAMAQLNPISDRVQSATARLGYAWVNVSEACTACGVCARACPTSAIAFKTGEDGRFVLAFQPQYCIDCEVCSYVCAAGAVSIQHEPDFWNLFASPGWVELASGSLTRCKRCKVLMAEHTGVEYCILCEFRRKNPFGSTPPPGVQALIDSMAGTRKP